MTEGTYYLDGEPIRWQALIEKARALGLKNSDGFYTTGEAAAALRELGHTVDHAPQSRPEVK